MENKKSKHVICPHCGKVDMEKTFWVTKMPFDKYTLQCNSCGKEFGCTVYVEGLVTHKLENEVK